MKYKWAKTDHKMTDNLGVQFQKIVRMMNQNQFTTRYRYIQGCQRFIGFVASEFKLQKLANIKDSHLEAYVTHLRDKELSSKYIKTELSAIRFLHNSMPITKFELMDSRRFNQTVGLTSTPDGRVDRAWQEDEFESCIKFLGEKANDELRDILIGVRYSGMRLDEICTLKDHQAKAALKKGYLELSNTKGGVPRQITLNNDLREVLVKRLSKNNRTEYLFTPSMYVNTRSIHKFEKKVQNTIYKTRGIYQRSDRTKSAHNALPNEKGALTMHGLRHTYAREVYFDKRNQGKSKYKARSEVAHLLGHGRDSVTEIYLAGLEG